MIPSATRPVEPLALLVRASLAILAAVTMGLGLAEVFLAPPMDDLQALAVYMLASCVVTVGAGALVVLALDKAGATSLRTRIALGAVVGAVIGLLNVLIVAQLMFVSTSHDLRLLAALVGFSCVVALGFSWWVASRVSGQLESVRRRIQGLAAGDYTTRLEPTGAGEISRQARDLNELARRLEQSAAAREMIDRERRDLTVAISHDLRTPLASIRAMAEALTDRVVVDADEVSRYHATIRTEVERLSRMVDDLFQVAQLDSGARTLDRRPLSLHEVAAEVVDGMQARAAAAGIALTLRSPETLPTLSLDGALMARAAGNLIANAIEHTPAGGEVVVAVGRAGRGQRLSVADTGEGVDPALKERIWEPFFRADPSRNRAAGGSGGAGLGLAIVRGVVEAHGGLVSVASSEGGGSVFAIEIPDTAD